VENTLKDSASKGQKSLGEDAFASSHIAWMVGLLVGGWEHSLFSHSVGNFIIPTDEVHHFSEG